jgi:hypothetical protein
MAQQHSFSKTWRGNVLILVRIALQCGLRARNPLLGAETIAIYQGLFCEPGVNLERTDPI